MSRFLGPIHHWLFNKIRLYEGLELQIIENVEKELNTNIKDMVLDIRNKIGEPMLNKNLEELIDTNNIHGWLQNKIAIAETRQAGLITKIINKFEEEGLKVIKETYKKQAISCGKDAALNYDVSTAPALYKALNNYILDGMPCDNVNNISLEEENKLQWKVERCLHRGYWDTVNGDVNVLYILREIWITYFVESANPAFKYDFAIQNINAQTLFIHQINKAI